MVVQVALTVVAVLIVAMVMRSSGGWFATVSDRAQIWSDLAVFMGLVWGVPLFVSVLDRRTGVAGVQTMLAIGVFFVVAAMHALIHR